MLIHSESNEYSPIPDDTFDSDETVCCLTPLYR